MTTTNSNSTATATTLQHLRDTFKKINISLEHATDLMSQLKDEVSEEHRGMESARSEFEQLKNKMNIIASGTRKKVKLNVGGTVFMSTVDTLTVEKPTFFSAMFSEHFDTQPDEDGEIFIDRDPTHFPIILNHLRGKDMSGHMDALSPVLREDLIEELQYYQIGSLLDMAQAKAQTEVKTKMNAKQPSWTFDPSWKHAGLQLSNGNLTVSSTGNGAYTAVTGTQSFSTGVHQWKVRIDNICSSHNWVGLGVCQRSQLRSQDINQHTKYYGFSANGHSWTLGNPIANSLTWPSGTEVTLTLDCTQRTISQSANGNTVTVSGLPANTELHLIFILSTAGTQISLLELD